MSEEKKRLLAARAAICTIDLSVGDVMTANPKCLAPSDTLNDLYETLLKHQVRHVPVVEANGSLRGLITQRDLLRFSESELKEISSEQRTETLKKVKLEDVMRDERVCSVESVAPDYSLRSAAIHMLEMKIGCVPVVDDQYRLVGILTESDFLKIFSEGI